MKTSTQTKRELENRKLARIARQLSALADTSAGWPQREHVLLTISIAARKLAAGFSQDAAIICRDCKDDLPGVL